MRPVARAYLPSNPREWIMIHRSRVHARIIISTTVLLVATAITAPAQEAKDKANENTIAKII
jgi:hypothetical protein